MTEPHTIDRDEVEKLLPWYVAGTLDAADMTRVEAFLSTTSEFDTQIASIREDLGEAILANESIHGPEAGALERLMAKIDEEPSQASLLRSSTSGLFSGIENFLRSLSPGRLGFAAMAAALLIAIQAGLLGSNLLQTGATYETAGGQPRQTSGTVLLIKFKADADIGAISTFLTTNKARILSGPENGAFFKIGVETEKLAVAARDALVKRMEKQTELVEVIVPSQ